MVKALTHAVDHVYLIDAGRLWVDFPKPVTGHTYNVSPDGRYQFYQHGNVHGVSFAITYKGFVMAYYPELEESLAEYLERRELGMNRVSSTVSTMAASPMKSVKVISCATTPYLLALSPDEQVLAVAYGQTLDLYAVADFLYSKQLEPLRRLEENEIAEAAWCPLQVAPHQAELCVLSKTGKIKVVRTDGQVRSLKPVSPPRSICWSPDGSHLAIGTACGTVEVFYTDGLNLERAISRPESCDKSFQAHHVNWAEDDLILVGFKKFNQDETDETVQVYLFENGTIVEMGQIVPFGRSDLRKHQLYSVYLKEWRMFFVGCSLSSRVELVVCAPDTGKWEIWRLKTRYQAKLPLDSKNQETALVGMQLVLNSSLPIKIGEANHPAMPIISCLSTDCVVANFSVVDLSEREELEFLMIPTDYSRRKTRGRLFSK